MATPSKASLTKELRKLGIDIPASASIKDLSHRLKYWRSNEGYRVRLLRNPNTKFDNHPISLLENKTILYWLPDSQMAQDMIASKILLVLGRTTKPSKDAIIFDVPSDYESRWGHGSINKSN